MSRTVDFYTSGPYLHNPPTQGYVDRYTQALGGQGITDVSSKIENMTSSAVEGLRRRAADAYKVEQQFFSLFHVSSADEWSRKYLVTDSPLWNPALLHKYWVSHTLESKTIAAINTTKNRAILRGESFDKNTAHLPMLNVLKQLNTKLAEEALGGALGYYMAQQGTLDDLTNQLLGGLNAERAFSALQGGAAGEGIIGITDIIFQAVSLKRSMVKDLETKIANFATEQFTDSFNNALHTRPEGKKLQRYIRNSLKKGHSNVQDFLRAVGFNLERTLTHQDFGYKYMASIFLERYYAEKGEYIRDVINTLQDFLQFKGEEQDIDSQESIRKIPGGLGEITVEIVLEGALKKFNFNNLLKLTDLRVERIGQRVGTNIRTSVGGKQLPVDVRVVGLDANLQEMFFNIQVKNFRMEGKAGKDRLKMQMHQGDIPIGFPEKMSDLFQDLQHGGFFTDEQTKLMAYMIANQSYRGEVEELTAVSNLLNFAIENLVASATAKAMFRDETYKEAGKTITKKGDIMGNHFILLHGRKLIGMSSFLLAAADILEGKGAADHGNDMFVYPKIKPAKPNEPKNFVASTDVVNAVALREEKRNDAKGTFWKEGDPYGQAVLAVGRKYGQTIIGSMPSPDVSLSITYILTQINNLIPLGGGA